MEQKTCDFHHSSHQFLKMKWYWPQWQKQYTLLIHNWDAGFVLRSRYLIGIWLNLFMSWIFSSSFSSIFLFFLSFSFFLCNLSVQRGSANTITMLLVLNVWFLFFQIKYEEGCVGTQPLDFEVTACSCIVQGNVFVHACTYTTSNNKKQTGGQPLRAGNKTQALVT